MARAGRANPAWSCPTVGALEHWPGDAEQATPVLARPVTAGSARIAPVTVLGPLFVTVRVYVVEPPALTALVPSVLVIARSATTGIRVRLLEELLPGLRSLSFETVAVLVTLGTAASVGLTVTEMSGRLAPAARPPAGVTVQVTSWPDTPQLHPAPTAETTFSPAGTASLTVIRPARLPLPTFWTLSM